MSLHSALHSAVQIFYNGHAHWVATFFDGNEVFLFDSLTHDDLLSSLEEQIVAVYASCCSKDAWPVDHHQCWSSAAKRHDGLGAVCNHICLSLCMG